MWSKAKRAWRLWLIVGLLAVVIAAVYMHDTYEPAVLDGAYEWSFSTGGTSDAPSTKVQLEAGGETHALGSFDGTCAVEKGDYLQYEKSRVVCLYGVRGQEIGVFEEPGQVVVRVGDIDEGASGVPGFRGNFVLHTIIR